MGRRDVSQGRRYDGFVPGRFPIDAYGNGGFRFADMSHRGSILALPSGIKAWDVAAVGEMTPAAIAPLVAEAEAIDFVLVGTGQDILPLPEPVRRAFREAGLRVDLMQTGAAARTYNIVMGENRKVAAALIAVA